MKKRLLALAMASVMVIGTGCSSGKTDAPATTPTQTEAKTESKAETDTPKETEGSIGPVTIKVASCTLLEQDYEAFQDDVEIGFETENPNTTIKWVTAPYGGIMSQAINMADGGDGIDMMFGEIRWVPGPMDAGLTVSMADVLPADYLVGFYPAILDSLDIDGQPYGLSIYVFPYVLHYSTELLGQASLDPAAPPTTYDEMLEYAEKLFKLKDPDGNPVYAFGQTTVSVPISGSLINGMIFDFGGILPVDNGTLSIGNQGSKDIIIILKTLDKEGYNSQNAKLKDLRGLFALGQLAMYYNRLWGSSRTQFINPDAKNFTVSAKPLLGGAGKRQSILQAHCLMYADNGDAQREVYSRLTQHLVTSEVLSDYLANITPVYSTKKDMGGSENMNPILAGAIGSVENVTAQVFVPQINDLNLEPCTLAQSVTVSDKDMDAVTVDFKKAAKAILEQ